MTRKVFLSVLLTLAIIAGFSFFTRIPRSQLSNSTTTPTSDTISQQAIETPAENAPELTTVATGLEVPWAIAFLPDRSFLVTERPGRVRMVTSDGNLQPEPLLTIQTISRRDSEGGLLGIALHPDFSSNHFVYLYYTYESAGNQTKNRVARYTLENNKLINETVIVDAIPGALYHNGGRIKFGPDKMLYITTGDSQDPSLAQSTSATAGKILRVTDGGKPAPGNPFGNLTYSYGHRNPQGITWDASGKLWETEHGRSNPTGFDEVNLIEPGKNYGWDIIQGDETKEGMVTPKRNSGPTTTWAPAGAAFLPTGRQGAGHSLFFAGLKGQSLYEAVIQNDSIVELKEHYKGEFGRLREVIPGPDGMLYVTTSNRDGRGSPRTEDDKILKINPRAL